MRQPTSVGTGSLALLAVAALAGCTAHHSTSIPTATGSAAQTTASTCPITTVRTDPLPAAIPGFIPTNGPAGPWMGDARFAAVLFYAAGDDPTMRAQGRMAAGQTTKVFWWVAAGGDTMTVQGREQRSGRTFSQVMEGIGGGQFPTVPVVPSAGCWTLTVSVSGRDVGAITIPVTGPLGT